MGTIYSAGLMVKLIIFDIGGVIIDYDEDYYIRYISRKLGLNEQTFAKTMNPLIVRMEYGRITTEYAESVLSKKFHIPELDLEWLAAYKRLSRLNKPVAALIARLMKHHRLVLLSNISASRYIESKRLFLDGIKHGKMFASCYLHMRKPERRLYLYVLKATHTKPEDAIFIDNMKENVDGARKAGIASIRYENYTQIVKELRKRGIYP